MSLFGDFPDDPPQASPSATAPRPRNTLFDDDALPAAGAGAGAGSSLFADEPDEHASPWGLPTPKKAQSKAEQINGLLHLADVPDLYHDVFEEVQRKGEYGPEGDVDAEGAGRVFQAARLGEEARERVLGVMRPVGGRWRRDAYNVFLALVGLAQLGEEVGLDAVDEWRRSESSIV
jgi:sorting nexin-8